MLNHIYVELVKLIHIHLNGLPHNISLLLSTNQRPGNRWHTDRQTDTHTFRNTGPGLSLRVLDKNLKFSIHNITSLKVEFDTICKRIRLLCFCSLIKLKYTLKNNNISRLFVCTRDPGQGVKTMYSLQNNKLILS